MEKEVIRKSNINLTCPAKPGASLAFLGKNMAKFAREFNEKVKDKSAKYVKVEVKIFRNGNYEFKIKNPPLIHKLLNRPDNYEQLSKEEKKKIREKERKEISSEEFRILVQEILPFLNTTDLGKAQKIVAGVAQSVGVKVNQTE
jgi:large subunit ribosomal protein L11